MARLKSELTVECPCCGSQLVIDTNLKRVVSHALPERGDKRTLDDAQSILRAEAARLGTEFLGELPLTLEIRELADAGTPIVAARPESDAAATYRAIAARLWAKLEAGTAPAGPSIIVE